MNTEELIAWLREQSFDMADPTHGVPLLGRAKLLRDAADELRDLRAKNDRLLEAMRGVEQWWLSDQAPNEHGAPACIFRLRAVLNGWDETDGPQEIAGRVE